MDTKLIVSASPHVRSDETTQSLMANVIVALCPCVVASAIIFGVNHQKRTVLYEGMGSRIPIKMPGMKSPNGILSYSGRILP